MKIFPVEWLIKNSILILNQAIHEIKINIICDVSAINGQLSKTTKEGVSEKNSCFVNVDCGYMNPEAVTEGSIVALIDDQPEVAVTKSELLEEDIVKKNVIFKTANSNSKLKPTEANKLK